MCVSLFYVIDTGSIRPRARILGGPSWRLLIYPSLLAQTLAVPIYPYPYWEPQSASGLFWNPGHGLPEQNPKTETGRAALPGQDHMYPFGVIGVALRYIPAGAVIELAGFRLGCTSTPTGIRETQAGGNRIQGHLSRGGPEYRADSGSLIP